LGGAVALGIYWVVTFQAGPGFQAPGTGLEVLLLPIIYAMIATAYLVISFVFGFIMDNIYAECAVSIACTWALFYWIDYLCRYH
jgi:hypothetical protein